jgi:hypothetical protein
MQDIQGKIDSFSEKTPASNDPDPVPPASRGSGWNQPEKSGLAQFQQFLIAWQTGNHFSSPPLFDFSFSGFIFFDGGR